MLELKRITVPPGQTVTLDDVSWDEFEAILEDLGESRSTRTAYDRERLEIRIPFPEQEISKVSISNLEEKIDWM